MKKCMTLCLMAIQALCCGLEPSEKISLSMALDDRQWVVQHQSLPFGQDTICLAPCTEQGPNKAREEMQISKLPRNLKISDLVAFPQAGSTMLMDAIYVPNKEFALAFGDERHQIYIERFVQGSDAVYHLKYFAPEAMLTEQSLHQWWKRICHAKVGSEASNTSWLSVTPKGVFRNGLQLPQDDKWEDFHHPTQPFSVNLPSSWQVLESNINYPCAQTSPFCTTLLFFKRIDGLVAGVVVKTDMPIQATLQDKERAWEDAMAELFNSFGRDLLAQGDFENKEGGYDKYTIVAMGDEVVWTRYIHTDDALFSIQTVVNRQNFKAAREVMRRILYDFEVNRKQVPPTTDIFCIR